MGKVNESGSELGLTAGLKHPEELPNLRVRARMKKQLCDLRGKAY